ncbi:LacI family DNA-binding transcriptional regulator [Streptomyces sp. 3MP-14]|uniref:LacI family DNA-binding transcriptional regulator n=1 Tax=Streptomyces mimosae TaxID=2586635 RepID=A0A5N6AKX3_9ACTN|nr:MULTISPECIES: LacI family DNA-binding transcriptional regulator [Streptomyces]KAB8168703.1 LacI family DNA-binding transcriptional regulator [Streptomyces mimosae]KAB8178017.1 LacI family DNA-binding transcriptional regulator [Streptomyces sp. 3MP-14]
MKRDARPEAGRDARTVRITDVARAAGVSPSTVSKALNDSGSLRESTRERVRAAAERLGFVSDAGARALSMRRTFIVGLLSTDNVGRFSLPVMLGAENALTVGEISTLVATAPKGSVQEQHHLRTLVARRVDGIIVTGKATDHREPISVPVPVVYALAPSTDPDDMSVVPDDAAGMRLVVDHLRTLGHHRVAHVGGRPEHRTSQVRLASLRAALDQAGMELVGEPLLGEWSEPWGRQAVDVLLRAGGAERPPMTAVVCASDQLARAVGDRLRERGVRVPHEVAVTGYDNWQVMWEASRPPLTTVDMELETLGRRAAERLLAAITADPENRSADRGIELVPPRLVVRGSSLADD